MKYLRRYRRYLFLPLVFAPLAWLMACSSAPTTRQAVDAEMARETAPHPGGEMAMASQNILLQAEGLSSEQREKLISLHGKVAGEMSGIREDMGKLKMMLFKTMMDPKGDQKKLNHVKNRILKLDREKTNLMLSALDEAQLILGRKSMEDEGIYRALMMMERPWDSGPR